MSGMPVAAGGSSPKKFMVSSLSQTMTFASSSGIGRKSLHICSDSSAARAISIRTRRTSGWCRQASSMQLSSESVRGVRSSAGFSGSATAGSGGASSAGASSVAGGASSVVAGASSIVAGASSIVAGASSVVAGASSIAAGGSPVGRAFAAPVESRQSAANTAASRLVPLIPLSLPSARRNRGGRRIGTT